MGDLTPLSKQFHFDVARHSGAAGLHPEHQTEFGRLSAALSTGVKSQLLFVECRDVRYRERLIVTLGEVLAVSGLRAGNLDVSGCATFLDAEQRLAELSQRLDAVHLLGGERWFDEARWREFNVRREAVARGIATRLVLWLHPEQIPQLVEWAPDLWAWRAGVYDFVARSEAVAVAAPAGGARAIDNRNLQERAARMAAIQQQLGLADVPDTTRAMMLDELADLRFRLGDLDEALRIRRDEQLPVFEKLGDVRSRAVTQAKLGQTLLLKGNRQAALELWRAAHADFERMRLPEAALIKGWLDELDQPAGSRSSA